jgi:hypothetical protein
MRAAGPALLTIGIMTEAVPVLVEQSCVTELGGY